MVKNCNVYTSVDLAAALNSPEVLAVTTASANAPRRQLTSRSRRPKAGRCKDHTAATVVRLGEASRISHLLLHDFFLTPRITEGLRMSLLKLLACSNDGCPINI